MYSLICDGQLIAQTAGGGIAFESGTLLERVGAAGVLSCTLLPENPYKDLIALRSSVLVLERSGAEIFRGQAISTTVNGSGFFEIAGLGDMSYLRDVLVAPFTYTGTLAGLFGQILTYYRAGASAAKKIYAGTVGVSAGTVSYELTNYRSAWDLISDLTDTYGGVLSMRQLADGTRGLDWLEDPGIYSAQAAIWGDNLLSLDISNDAGELVNTLIAEGEDGITVTRTAPASIARYGAVHGYQRFPGATNTYDLQNLADAALQRIARQSRSVSGRAIDKWAEGFSPFRLGACVHTISQEHLLDEWLVCSELRHDLTMDKPEQVTLGRIGDSLTASGRTIVINRWIAGTQGLTPPKDRAIDANGVYATDSNGDYAVSLRLE